MDELVPGGNMALPGGVLTFRVPGPFDVSAVVTDDGGRVRGDGDLVFYNQPAAPGARLAGESLTVDPAALRAGAGRVTVVVSPAEPGTPLGRLPAPILLVTGPDGRPLARFAPPRPERETVLLLAEVYRRGPAWKLRALGQGYADGLAGIARDFGIEVAEDATGSGTGPANATPTTATATATATAVTTTAVPGAGAGGADPVTEGFLRLVNSARAGAGSPPVVPDARLTAVARAHAAGMAQRGRLGSEGADGLSLHQRVTAGGYAYLTVGEHLVSGPRDAAEFVEYCLSGGRTRRTVQDPAFTEAGVACVTDGRSGTPYWTALWAAPLTPAGLARTAAEVLALTNAERAAAGLPPLADDPLLTRAAQAHSTDMVARAFYSHTSPDGSEPWHRAAAAGSSRRTIGENIACGQRSPAEVVRGWMDSPGHRANILKPAFTHLGVGFAGGGPAGTYWTQLFGA
ncbi:CAP domain-containing protein [Streptomyces apricus]|uniref:Stress protein n=1 Tax=Streptomyces apricus TaxID=1828112 RepID=A0A5B0BHT8_9ACTN|nr:CAP domain-containing protein [Streptomyces apricus]KAA0940539.1 stress protein [Streptomyces apricus]